MHTKIKNKYIGTLLSSQTSSPHNSYMPKSMELVASKKLFSSGPVFLSPLQPGTFLFLWGAVGRADSYKVTHGLNKTQMCTSLKVFSPSGSAQRQPFNAGIGWRSVCPKPAHEARVKHVGLFSHPGIHGNPHDVDDCHSCERPPHRNAGIDKPRYEQYGDCSR